MSAAIATILIVIYVRVSTDEQARSGYSLAEQVRACRQQTAQLAATLGVEASVLEFSDDMSGEILERPGLQAALEILRRQPTAYFVCLDPDRLARRLMHQLLITDQIEGAGCKMEFVQHDYQSTPEGLLFYQLRGAVAEFEKAKILERTSRGARGKIKAGGLPYNLRIYGYRYVVGLGKVKANETLVPHQVEAEWVRTIYRWCALEGMGPLSIARRLNDLGVATKTGMGRWQHGQVRRILNHDVFVTGQLTVNKKDHKGIFVARQLPPEERARKGIKLSARAKPREEWQYLAVDPILSEELWKSAQEVLAGFRIGGRADNHPGQIRMLTGLGRCGMCGATLYYLGGTKISCSGRYHPRWTSGELPSECTLPSKSREAIERAVWAKVRGWLLNPEELRRDAEVAAKEEHLPTSNAEGLRAELDALEAQLSAKREEQNRTGLLFARGSWPAEMALPALDRIREEIQALEDRLRELRKQVGNQPVHSVADSPVLRLLADPAWLELVQSTLDDLDPARRLELVRLVVGRYVLQPSERGQAPDIRVFLRVS